MNVTVSFPVVEEKLAEIVTQLTRIVDSIVKQDALEKEAKEIASDLEKTVDSLESDVSSTPK